MSKERELLERVLTSELWSVQEELQAEIKWVLAQPEPPPMTQREMYQRGYAQAERDLKRAHPHAEIIMKYAEVAARRPDPWVEFEWFDGCIGEWVKCKDTMCFNFDKYRHIGEIK